ncbi:MAG: hypothetical protein ACI3VP_07840 [Oscillospiraceae bacterium]
MQNISSESYPYLTVREQRGSYIPASSKATQIYADNGAMLIVSPYGITYNGIYITDTVSPETAELVRFGDRVVLMPDKKVINLKYRLIGFYEQVADLPETAELYDGAAVRNMMTGELHLYVWDGSNWVDNGKLVTDMDAVVVNEKAVFMDGTLYDEKATANTIKLTNVSAYELTEVMGFREGDAVTITGCTKLTSNNKTPVIRQIEGVDKNPMELGVYLRFSDFCFTMPENEDGTTATEYTESSITISRQTPEMDIIFEHENRLWGAKGKEIFASKLGDPFNWNCFEGLSTDSYYLQTQDKGEITAGISFGYPRFFRQDSMTTVYGSMPSAFQTQRTELAGVKSGEKKSLERMGGLLFWLSADGIVIFDGSKTYLQEQVFGDWTISKVISKAGGRKLYMAADLGKHPLADGERLKAVLCYDAESGLWTKENDPGIKSMTYMDGTVYALKSDGIITMNGLCGKEAAEIGISSYAEFGDFTDGDLNRKAVSRVQLRMELEEGAWVNILIGYDGEEWTRIQSLEAGKKRSVYIPVIPRRSDHYRIRIEGVGKWTLYSMARELYIGSAVH